MLEKLNPFSKKTIHVRVYTDDINFENDTLVKIEDNYHTKDSNIKLGNFDRKAVQRNEKGEYFMNLFSPDLKKVTIISNDFKKDGHKYLIPEVTNIAKNKLDGISEEVFLKRFLDKHAKEILFFLSVFFVFLIVTTINKDIKIIGDALNFVGGQLVELNSKLGMELPIQ